MWIAQVYMCLERSVLLGKKNKKKQKQNKNNKHNKKTKQNKKRLRTHWPGGTQHVTLMNGLLRERLSRRRWPGTFLAGKKTKKKTRNLTLSDSLVVLYTWF
jgi:hypothetical protein